MLNISDTPIEMAIGHRPFGKRFLQSKAAFSLNNSLRVAMSVCMFVTKRLGDIWSKNLFLIFACNYTDFPKLKKC